MYIGKTPALGNYQKCDAITTSATATYNLTVGSVAVSPETANNCIVSLNGVIQAPTDAFTISGSTIVFNSALTTADVIDFILILGNVLDIGTPSDGTVTAAKLADTAISGKTALAVAPADTDEFLVSDAGTLKRLDYSLIKGSSDYVKIKSQTASSTTAIDFINGSSDVILDSTYKIYKFFFYNMAPATDDTQFQIRTSTDAGTTWDELIGGNSYGAFEPPGSNTFTNTSWDNGSIVGAVGNAAAEDCNGECGGTAQVDDCGICDGIDVINDGYCQDDIDFLEDLISNSSTTINMQIDFNDNGIIEPLELVMPSYEINWIVEPWNNGKIQILSCLKILQITHCCLPVLE